MGKSYTAKYQIGREYKLNHIIYLATRQDFDQNVTLKPIGIDLGFKTFPKNSKKTIIRKQVWR